MNATYWLAQNLSDVPVQDDWLSEGERSILAGFRFPKRRNDWRLGRWTAKQAIYAYRQQSHPNLSSLEIRAAADGAPEVFWNNTPGGVSLSISHALNRSLCAVGPADLAIGCDIEQLERREDSLVLDYFTPEEISLCHQAVPENRTLVVNLIWSAKESVLKALREGLRRDTRSVFIRPDFGEQEKGWNAWTGHCPELARSFYGWWRAADGFVYTLASDKWVVVSGKW